MPAPWVLDHREGSVYWTIFSDESSRAHDDRLCQVCGLELGAYLLLGIHRPGFVNGPGCHPRCMALSLSFCPHFQGGIPGTDHVAYLHSGTGVGYTIFDPEFPDEPYQDPNPPTPEALRSPLTSQQVIQLAKRDPLGEDADYAQAALLSGAAEGRRAASRVPAAAV